MRKRKQLGDLEDEVAEVVAVERHKTVGRLEWRKWTRLVNIAKKNRASGRREDEGRVRRRRERERS